MRKVSINTNILLAAIFILSPLTYGNVSAKFSSPTFSPANKYYIVDTTQEIVKTLTISVNIQEGVNVYGWQANILFDPSELIALNVKAGDFLAKNSITLNSTSPEVSAQE